VFGITPDDQVGRVFENIVKDVKEKGNHPSTGFLGTAYLLPVLSRYGEHELAYQLASQKEYPSWGYMVEKEATTIWELWDSDTQGPGMNSRNHFALGSVGEWFYAWLAGIQPSSEGAGFKKIIIAPKPAADLTWAEAKLQSLYGEIYSSWKKSENKISLQVKIPANTSARIHVPHFGQQWPLIEESGNILIKAGQETKPLADIRLVEITDQATIFEVGAGDYHFNATL